MRGNFTIGQIRQFAIAEKIKVKSQKFQNSLLKNRTNFTDTLPSPNKNWSFINQVKEEKSLKLKSKKVIIYPYSLSNNLLKEVLLKMEFKFVLTNEIQKASLIIGLKKHLKRNTRVINLAKQKNIPVYSLDKISFYEVSKLIQFICS